MSRHDFRVAEEARAWWADVRRSAPAVLAGLWFGLVELAPDGWHLYVAGTAEFDADDETAEWAVGPYAWWPKDRYLPLPDVGELPLGEAVAKASDLVRSIAPWDDLGVAGVAVGFDDGDFTVVFTR